ncbi:MAG: sulfurtransferase TusA [Pseudomonadota bacterium]|nr:sulfurtransferase TusA [Pseudomonadota bacterium]
MVDATKDSSADWRTSADEVLDTSGLRCPEPLMLLRNRMRTLATGARVHAIATDPASVRDFEQFASFLGHAIIERSTTEKCFEFLIEKGRR